MSDDKGLHEQIVAILESNHFYHHNTIATEICKVVGERDKEYEEVLERYKHYHVNNGTDDFCRECNLYLTHPIHIRG